MPGVWKDLGLEPDSDVKIDILPTESPTSGKAQRLILSICLNLLKSNRYLDTDVGNMFMGVVEQGP